MPMPRMFGQLISARRLSGWARRVCALRFQHVGFLRAAQGHAIHRLCPNYEWSGANPRSVLIALPLCAAERKRLAMNLDGLLLGVFLRYRGGLHRDSDQ